MHLLSVSYNNLCKEIIQLPGAATCISVSHGYCGVLFGTVRYTDTRYPDTVGVNESLQGTRFICVSETPVNGNSMCNNYNKFI